MTDEDPPIGIQQSVNSLVAERLEHLIEARKHLEYIATYLADSHGSKPHMRQALTAVECAIKELKLPYPDAGLPTRNY